MTNIQNIFSKLPPAASEEWVDVLVGGGDVRIERIVSHGQRSPEGFWYDQSEAEWVIVLRGEARLLFEGADAPRRMVAGDFVHIPPHVRHRVEETSAGEPTVWLAVFYSDPAGTA